jgi:hypothetical protein
VSCTGKAVHAITASAAVRKHPLSSKGQKSNGILLDFFENFHIFRFHGQRMFESADG